MSGYAYVHMLLVVLYIANQRLGTGVTSDINLSGLWLQCVQREDHKTDEDLASGSSQAFE